MRHVKRHYTCSCMPWVVINAPQCFLRLSSVHLPVIGEKKTTMLHGAGIHIRGQRSANTPRESQEKKATMTMYLRSHTYRHTDRIQVNEQCTIEIVPLVVINSTNIQMAAQVAHAYMGRRPHRTLCLTLSSERSI